MPNGLLAGTFSLPAHSCTKAPSYRPRLCIQYAHVNPKVCDVASWECGVGVPSNDRNWCNDIAQIKADPSTDAAQSPTVHAMVTAGKPSRYAHRAERPNALDRATALDHLRRLLQQTQEEQSQLKVPLEPSYRVQSGPVSALGRILQTIPLQDIHLSSPLMHS